MAQIAVLLMIGLLFGTHGAFAADPIEATTRDGKGVLLKADGTWTYAQEKKPIPQGEGLTKPETATKDLVSKKGFVEVWYNPAKWTPTTPGNPAHEFNLVHSSGEAQAVLIVDRLAMPMESLKNMVLTNAKQAAPDAVIASEREQTVNGAKVTAMRLNGTIQGIPFSYYGYYWTGNAGCVQFLAYSGQTLFDEFAIDFNELLNGLVITKPQ